MKVIANNLRKAASERQREANDLRTEIGIRESEMKDQLSQIESQISRNKTDVLEHTNQSSTVIANTGSITHLKQQKKTLERDFNKYRSSVEQVISQKENDAISLNQEASNFENRAAND